MIKEKLLHDWPEGQILTAKELLNWYDGVKGGTAPTYQSNLYALVINPLVKKGILTKVAKGVYIIGSINESSTSGYTSLDNTKEIMEKEEKDEFDLLLEKKLASY